MATPFFIFQGGGFFVPAPFFRPLGRVFTLIRPLFSRAAPPVFNTRRARRGYPRGVYLSPGGGIFMRLSGHFYVFSPIFGNFPDTRKAPGIFPGDHGAGSLFLRCVRRVADGKFPPRRYTSNGRFIVMERVRAKPEPVFAKIHGSDSQGGRPSYAWTVNSQCQCEEHKNLGSNSRDHDPKAKTLHASRLIRHLFCLLRRRRLF